MHGFYEILWIWNSSVFRNKPEDIEDSLQKTHLMQRELSEFKGLIDENPSSLARSEFKVLAGTTLN
jgi:hypothetical protein